MSKFITFIEINVFIHNMQGVFFYLGLKLFGTVRPLVSTSRRLSDHNFKMMGDFRHQIKYINWEF